MFLQFPEGKLLSVSLRLNLGNLVSIENLFSEASLAQPITYFWVSHEPAANQATLTAGEMERIVNWE